MELGGWDLILHESPGQSTSPLEAMRPALTIVLPCYNEAAGIVRSLTALRAWFPGDTQILVIDDGSTDRTADLARPRVKRRILAPTRSQLSVEQIPAWRGRRR